MVKSPLAAPVGVAEGLLAVTVELPGAVGLGAATEADGGADGVVLFGVAGEEEGGASSPCATDEKVWKSLGEAGFRMNTIPAVAQ